jgi:hypothetical protein
MRRLLGVLIVLAIGPAEGQEPPRTWRVDYYHTGGLGQELFALDRIVAEPLSWSGSLDRSLEPVRSGMYRFEVRDASGRPVYSRGFSSIYGEWVTTAEAGRIRRTFHESLRFPAPEGLVRVVVQKRNPRGDFDEVWDLEIDPRDMFIDRSLPPRVDLLTIEQNGASPEKVDVLLLGDGYTAAQCSAKFRDDARRMVDVLFSQEPFKARRRDFNVWGLCPPSPQPGVSRPSTGTSVRSPAGATYDAFGSERYILTFDNRALRDLAAWAPYEFVEILVNNDTYGGGGIFNLFATVAVDNDWAGYVFIHEFAHHFSGLADEYYTSPVAYEPPKEIVEPWEPNVTALLEPKRLKWADLVSPDVPIPTPWPKTEFEEHSKRLQSRRQEIRAARRSEAEMSALFREEQAFQTRLLDSFPHAGRVGAFQGANYDAEAFYRPEIDCVMFTRNEVPFCAVCRRALSSTIDLYAGTRPALPGN